MRHAGAEYLSLVPAGCKLDPIGHKEIENQDEVQHERQTAGGEGKLSVVAEYCKSDEREDDVEDIIFECNRRNLDSRIQEQQEKHQKNVKTRGVVLHEGMMPASTNPEKDDKSIHIADEEGGCIHQGCLDRQRPDVQKQDNSENNEDDKAGGAGKK